MDKIIILLLAGTLLSVGTLLPASIVMLAGFMLGFYIRGKRAKVEQFRLGQQIKMMHQQISVMEPAASQRQQQVKPHRQQQAPKHQQSQIEEFDISDPQNQLFFIDQCELYSVRPVNREASRVVYALDTWIVVNKPNWRFSFEVGMGAFIKTSDGPDEELKDAAFHSYNCKRVDFLLVDHYGAPKLVIEYNGSGHNLSDNADARMEVKRRALARANIPLLEIEAWAKKSEIVAAISEALDSAETAR